MDFTEMCKMYSETNLYSREKNMCWISTLVLNNFIIFIIVIEAKPVLKMKIFLIVR